MTNQNQLAPASILDVAQQERNKLDVAKPDAQVMLQVQTARAFPRSIKSAMQEARSMATLDRETAGSCFYKIPRAGKMIEGPSIRLAEIMASAWGNLAIQGSIDEVTETHVVARGVVWDMQSNVPWSIEHRQKITGKDGRRYSDDMITTTANASVSKAIRNAIFRAIPRAYVSAVEAEARRVAVGDQRTLAETRDKWIQWFNKLGVAEARVLKMLGKPSLSDVDLGDLETLTGVSTAIREGHANVNEVFPPEELGDGVGSFKKGAEAKPQQAAKPNGATGQPANAAAGKKPNGGAKRTRKKPGPKPGLVPQIERIKSADLATLAEIAANDERPEIVAAIARRQAELAQQAMADQPKTGPGGGDSWVAPGARANGDDSDLYREGDRRVRGDGVPQVFTGGEWRDEAGFGGDEPPPPTDDDVPAGQGGFGFKG